VNEVTLLVSRGANANYQANNGKSALSYALIRKDFMVVEYLLSCAGAFIEVDKLTQDGKSIRDIAIEVKAPDYILSKIEEVKTRNAEARRRGAE
jgi:hypothetical protein